MKTYIVSTHQKHFTKLLLMSTHNICYQGEKRKILCGFSSYLKLWVSSSFLLLLFYWYVLKFPPEQSTHKNYKSKNGYRNVVLCICICNLRFLFALMPVFPQYKSYHAQLNKWPLLPMWAIRAQISLYFPTV